MLTTPTRSTLHSTSCYWVFAYRGGALLVQRLSDKASALFQTYDAEQLYHEMAQCTSAAELNRLFDEYAGDFVPPARRAE